MPEELISGPARLAPPARVAARARALLPGIELGLLALALVLPPFLEDFWVLFATRVAILSLLALSFDLVWGYAGIMSFGQALFSGMAGYCTALLATQLGVTSVFVLLGTGALVGLFVALAVAALVILGKRAPSLVFVSLGTLTGSYVVERLARGWSFVGGQNGIPSLPRLTLGRFEIAEGPMFYYLALFVLVLVYVGLRFFTRSQLGLVLAGMRQQEGRIAFFGYRLQHLKGVTFCLAGLIAGISGCLYAFHEGYVGPGQLGPVQSTQVVLYVLFGGVGTLVGAVLGVSLVDLFSYFLSQRFETAWPIVLGVLLLLIVMYRPSGLIGLLVSDRERIGSFGRGGKTGEKPR